MSPQKLPQAVVEVLVEQLELDWIGG